MSNRLRILDSLILAGALCVPVGLNVSALAQEQERHDQDRQEQNDDRARDNRHDDDRHNDSRHDRDDAGEHGKRFYDREHREYHQWGVGEDTAYRHWLGERHREYADFDSLSSEQQQAYWNWRHDHPDAH